MHHLPCVLGGGLGDETIISAALSTRLGDTVILKCHCVKKTLMKSCHYGKCDL